MPRKEEGRKAERPSRRLRGERTRKRKENGGEGPLTLTLTREGGGGGGGGGEVGRLLMRREEEEEEEEEGGVLPLIIPRAAGEWVGRWVGG